MTGRQVDLVKRGAAMFASLQDADAAIMRHVGSYRDAAQALIDIHEQELWRDGPYESFEDYLAKRWSWSKGRGSQLETAGRFLRHLAVTSPKLEPPDNEAHFRPLTKIKRRKRKSAPWDFIEDEDAVQNRRSECWQIVRDQSVSMELPITGPFVESIVDLHYKGGVPVKKTQKLKVTDIELAFEQINECGLTPRQAVKKFGPAKKWKGYAKARKWIEACDG